MNENMLYKVLCKTKCDYNIVKSVMEHGYASNVVMDVVGTRLILEHSFDTSYLESNWNKRILDAHKACKWYTLDKPLFFCIGLKVMLQDVKRSKLEHDVQEFLKNKLPTFDEMWSTNMFIKLCMYTLLHPYEIYHRLYKYGCRYSSDVTYFVTLLSINRLVTLYIIGFKKRLQRSIFTEYACISYRDVFSHVDAAEENLIDYDSVEHRIQQVSDVDVSHESIQVLYEVCETGLEHCKTMFKHVSYYNIGNLLFTMLTCGKGCIKYVVTNLNTFKDIKFKHGVQNYAINDDKRGYALNDIPMPYDLVKNWGIKFVLHTKPFYHRLHIGALCSFAEYINIENKELGNIVGIPMLKQRIYNIIDTEAIDKGLGTDRYNLNKQIEVSNEKYKFFALPITAQFADFDKLYVCEQIRNILKLDVLPIRFVTQFNMMYALYDLKCEYTYYYIVTEDMLQHFYKTKVQLTLDILLNYAFIYLINNNVTSFKPIVCNNNVYVIGGIFKNNTVKHVFDASNKMLLTTILQKYWNRILSVLNKWCKIVIKSSLPPNVILSLYNRLISLYNINTWV